MKKPKPVWEQVSIVGMAEKGMAVGRDESGRVVFVKGAAPGDRVDVQIAGKRKGYWTGYPVRFLEYSPNRVEPTCQHFGICGGCTWQHLNYDCQLTEKSKIVQNALVRIGKVEHTAIEEILSSPHPFYYRNKMEFSFSQARWLLPGETSDVESLGALGLHPPGFFDKVVDIHQCHLMHSLADDIRNYVRALAMEHRWPFYHAGTGQGLLRSMIIRHTTLGQWMLVVCFAKENDAVRQTLLERVADRFEQLTSIYYVINSKANDSLFDLDFKHWRGTAKIEECLGSCRYLIGPKSFFQTNAYQAQRLYDLVRSYADLQADETVYDLYSGTGSIAIYLAADCRQVIGIEEVEAAVNDAHENGKLNEMSNVHFIAGDTARAFVPTLFDQYGPPDVVVTDPPRAGMDVKVVNTILAAAPKRIVYVSCNPATQARDIELMSSHYLVERMRAVDMFPQTSHIENVVLLYQR